MLLVWLKPGPRISLCIRDTRTTRRGIRLLKSNGREGSKGGRLIDVGRNVVAININHRSIHASQARLMADAAGVENRVVIIVKSSARV